MITGEYPPQTGGVSDYARVVARGLAAAGDTVHVYAPENPGINPRDDGVVVHRLPGHFGVRALAALSRSIRCGTHDRLLVQYVAQAFGFKAMNLPFCLWLSMYSRRYGSASVIFHEVNVGFCAGDPVRYRLLSEVTKVMARLVARSAKQIFITTPVWESLLRRYLPNSQSVTWLPVPSNIAVVGDCAQIGAMRRRYVSSCGTVIGHFGTYSPAIAAMLRAIIPRILAENSDSTMLMIGAHSDTFRDSLVGESPELAARVVATGMLPALELSLAISSCDVMAQPYPDGVTSRRTSMMAALEHARAIVTTQGSSTERLWGESEAVALVPVGEAAAFASTVCELIADKDRQRRYRTAAKGLYNSRFELRHTIEALRASTCASR